MTTQEFSSLWLSFGGSLKSSGERGQVLIDKYGNDVNVVLVANEYDWKSSLNVLDRGRSVYFSVRLFDLTYQGSEVKRESDQVAHVFSGGGCTIEIRSEAGAFRALRTLRVTEDTQE